MKEEAKADAENAAPSGVQAAKPKAKVAASRALRTKQEQQVAAVPQRNAKTIKDEELPGQPPQKRAKVVAKPVPEPAQIVDDLDAEDIVDPLMVSEYVHEIFDYMKQLEVCSLGFHTAWH